MRARLSAGIARAGTPPLESWDDIRTAYHVARAGTVSGAAEALGVHHATVIRHVDALEARLGTRLFQRHARGYTPTEAGGDLLRIAQATDEQFAELAARLSGGGDVISGELVITALPELSRFIVPCLARFGAAHRGLVTRLHLDTRLFRLEYGEAHVAIRAGAAPREPDNVVRPFARLRHALFAAPAYLAARGMPEAGALDRHVFVGGEAEIERVPFLRWLAETVPRERVVFRSPDVAARQQAVLEGAGLGFLPLDMAAAHPELTQVMPARDDWDAPLWLVTHVDLHRSAKVQAFLAHLRAEAADWPLAPAKGV